MTEHGASVSGPTRGVRKNWAPKCSCWSSPSSSSGWVLTLSTQRERKRVSWQKNPWSRPSSSRMSPRRSLTTKELPSRTLRVRSDKRHRLLWAARGGSVGGLVGAGYDIDVAVLGDPCAAVTRRDALQALDSRSHSGRVL